MIIPSHSLNFIHVPKAAGSSIGKELRSGLKITANDKKLQNEFTLYSKEAGYGYPNHAPARVKRDFLGAQEYKKYLSFAFVRNPYSLLVSIYEYTHQTEKKIYEKNGWEHNQFQNNILDNSFDDWILNFPTGKCQTDWLTSKTGGLLVDFIGRTENYENDSKKLFRLVGIEQDTSVKANATDHKHYREYYSEQGKIVVEKKYSKALKLFGYRF